MKRYRLFKLYLILMALIFCHCIQAQETKLSKSINKTFDVSGKLNLEITNKYGNVIVDTWSKDEVELKIEILAFGKDESAADKLMERVEFDFKHSEDFLEIESVFDRKKSFFRDLVNAVGDYSSSILSKQRLQVNYELNVPETITSISVDNRFGDVHIADIDGRINIKLSHGNLRVNNLNDYAKISVNYGTAKIKSLMEGNINLKGTELELEYATKLRLTSSSSTIALERVLDFDVESTNDKIEIDQVEDISGGLNFTELTISMLTERCRLDQSYGSMKIRQVYEGFTLIRVNGKSTDYNLTFVDACSFTARIYARADKLSIADFPGQREKRYMDDKSKFVQVSGEFGNQPEEKKINIDAQNGEVSIDFTDVLSENYNK